MPVGLQFWWFVGVSSYRAEMFGRVGNHEKQKTKKSYIRELRINPWTVQIRQGFEYKATGSVVGSARRPHDFSRKKVGKSRTPNNEGWSVVELVVSSSELLRQLNERILGQASTFVYGFNFDERRQNHFKKSEKSRKKSEILNNSPRISRPSANIFRHTLHVIQTDICTTYGYVPTELTLADSHNSQTCRFQFTMPFSGIRCALGMLIGFKERGSGMLIAVQRTAQTNKKQKSYPKSPMSVFFSLSR